MVLFKLGFLWFSICLRGRSQWPHGLRRHELSSLPRTMGSWIRIPLNRHGCLCAFILFVEVAALRRADHPSKESYRLCIGSRKWKSDQGPTKYCRAIDIGLRKVIVICKLVFVIDKYSKKRNHIIGFCSILKVSDIEFHRDLGKCL
jgi:hypothetical protein